MKKISMLLSVVFIAFVFVQDVYATNTLPKNEKVEIIFLGKDYEKTIDISSIKFVDSYDEISDKCRGVYMDYKNVKKIGVESIDNVLEDGALIMVETENNDEAMDIQNLFSGIDGYRLECEEENIIAACIYNLNGINNVSFVCAEDISAEITDFKGYAKKEFVTVVNDIDNDVYYTGCEINDKFGIIEEDFLYQMLNIEYYKKSTSLKKYYYGESLWATAYITACVYLGGQSEDIESDYVITSFEVSPVSKIHVYAFAGGIQTKNDNTIIADSSYLSDGKTVSYTLSSSVGVSLGATVGTSTETSGVNLSGEYERTSSITNTFESDGIATREDFSLRADGMVQWIAIPNTVVNGQSREIEPGIVVDIKGYKKNKADLLFVLKPVLGKNIILSECDKFSLRMSYGAPEYFNYK